MFRLTTILRVALYLTASLCCACGRQHPASTQSPADAAGAAAGAAASLRIVTSFKVQSLDPTRPASYFLTEFGIAELPLTLDGNSQLKPWLLESFAQIDERNWRLALRSNVKFQNGKPLTAVAMAAAMNRQMERSAATKAVLPEAIIKVTGERELTLSTPTPNSEVPAALADESAFPIYDVEALDAASGDATKLVGSGCYTGPYQATSLNEREMQMTRFENYWQGRPPLVRVSVRFVNDMQARILAVQNDEADLALYPSSDARRMLAGRQEAHFVMAARSNGGPRIVLNQRIAPFDELAVRRAFGLSIDYESLAHDLMDGMFETATSFYPPICPWAVQNQRTDIEQAKRLLDEAGWRLGADGIRYKNNQPLEAVILVYPQQPDWATIATAMQQQLKQVGLRLKIRQVEDINAAMKEKSAWNASINSPGVVTTGGSPDTFLRDYLTTQGARNYGGVADEELDKLIDDLSRTFDLKRRYQLLARIQQVVVVEKAYEFRPVFVRARVVVGKKYGNYQPSPHLRHITFETSPDGVFQ